MPAGSSLLPPSSLTGPRPTPFPACLLPFLRSAAHQGADPDAPEAQHRRLPHQRWLQVRPGPQGSEGSGRLPNQRPARCGQLPQCVWGGGGREAPDEAHPAPASAWGLLLPYPPAVRHHLACGSGVPPWPVAQGQVPVGQPHPAHEAVLCGTRAAPRTPTLPRHPPPHSPTCARPAPACLPAAPRVPCNNNTTQGAAAAHCPRAGRAQGERVCQPHELAVGRRDRGAHAPGAWVGWVGGWEVWAYIGGRKEGRLGPFFSLGSPHAWWVVERGGRARWDN